MEFKSGVSQRSVLGPMLWKECYNGLLKLDLPDEVHLEGFADRSAMIMIAKRKNSL